VRSVCVCVAVYGMITVAKVAVMRENYVEQNVAKFADFFFAARAGVRVRVRRYAYGKCCNVLFEKGREPAVKKIRISVWQLV
jgi:hypothetical protein